jgi:hypothetical protein
MTRLSPVALLLVSGLASLPARADVVTAGAITNLVATATTITSCAPVVATNPLGRSIIAWTQVQAPSFQVRVAFVDASGALVSGPTTITLPAGQSPGTVTAAATPMGFAIAYEIYPSPLSTTKDIYLQTFNLAGNPTGNTIAHSASATDEGRQSCAGFLNGNFIVAWARKRVGTTPSGGVYVRRFTSTAAPIDPVEVRVDNAALNVGYQDATGVATWPSGKVVVTWQDGLAGSTIPSQTPDGYGQGILYTVLDANLVPTALNVVATTITANNQFEPNVACDHRNGFVLGWCGDTTPTLVDAYVRRYTDAGAALDATDVNVTPGNTSTNQYLMGVAMTSNGESAATWMDESSTTGQPGPRVGFARYRQDRTLIEAGLVQPGGTAMDSQAFPRVGSDQYGNLLVAYQVATSGPGGNATGLNFRRLRRNMIAFGLPSPPPSGVSTIFLDSPSDANALYVVACSAGLGPLPLDTRHIRLDYDFLFDLSVFQGGGGIFFSFQGMLGPQGTTSFPAVVVPNLPFLSGLTIHYAFATGGSGAPSGVNTVSDTASMTIL